MLQRKFKDQMALVASRGERTHEKLSSVILFLYLFKNFYIVFLSLCAYGEKVDFKHTFMSTVTLCVTLERRQNKWIWSTGQQAPE